ncbi:methyl-accepting chemotaxis protein [uncultured Clostridium sp.]|uniref:methyl-accepting chemotaxis protein n=1 Tax=uncultured Clostridium sp. TaxID=59620 RepID=UPI0025FC6192|nr:methyl-accepting chemotaxis protein [uncultured Clostridium sp.]
MQKIKINNKFWVMNNSLRSLILRYVAVIIILSTGIITAINIFKINSSIKKESKSYLVNTASMSRDNFNSWFYEKINILDLLEKDIRLLKLYENPKENDILAYFNEEYKADNELLNIYFSNEKSELVNVSGWIPEADYIATERVWYTEAVKSNDFYISEPYVDAMTKETVISISKSIKADGTTVGVVGIDVTMETLKDMISDLSLEDGSYAFVIDKNEQIILHPNDELAPTDEKIFKLSDLSVDYGEMLMSQSGQISQSKDIRGNKTYSVLEPLDYGNLNMIFNYPKKIMIKQMVAEIILDILIMIISIIFSGFFIYKFSEKYVTPIEKTSKLLQEFSRGNLKIDSSDIEKNSKEVIEMTEIVDNVAETLNSYIIEISSVLGEFAKGDFTAEPQLEYVGDFYAIKQSMMFISDKLNATLNSISSSAEELKIGANDIENVSNNIADSATHQSSIIEEFLASIEEISNNIIVSIKQIEQTGEISKETKQNAVHGADAINEMLISMDEISESSKNISSIIKIIDDIASQINLLALNAMIEAQRAGEAGRGFAVVAEEVGHLAERSAETVREIENIIKDTLDKVKHGQEVVDNTSKSFNSITNSIEHSAQITQNILENSESQKGALEELVLGTNQISDILEKNLCTSQESQAVSEELMSHAVKLKELIEYFKLK